MSDFVNDWVRCNTCFKCFDDNGGILTSCGHFFCNRSNCRLSINDRKTKCPICKSSCEIISLTDTLPPEILQFFEEPENMLQKALDILRFHNNQKELTRKFFSENTETIKELKQRIENLKNENQKLIEELETLKSEKGINSEKKRRKEVIIPGIIGNKKKQKNEFFKIPQNKETEKPQTTIKIEKEQPISKLFTPTLASRIQNLTGKKVFEPV